MKRVILVSAILMFSATGYAECPLADLTGDCFVGLEDLAVLAGQWEGEPNAADFSIMASQWGTEDVPDDPENLVWVYIDDSGAGMKDGDGNPISHGGFTGEMSRYETTSAQYCQHLNAALDSNDITVGVDRYVYGANGSNGGADFVGEVYFRGGGVSGATQIIYSGGTFRVQWRDGYDMSNHPVVGVSWYGATAFCNYYGYRLPTEWEWQAVADYDGSYIYGCGYTLNYTKANYFAYADRSVNPLNLSHWPFTSPVDYFPSYGYGMNDMAGNAWEWTDSIYSATRRVIVGGSWRDYGMYCSVSQRYDHNQSRISSFQGFRVCR